MKRFLTALIILTLAFYATSCDESSTPPQKSTKEPVTDEISSDTKEQVWGLNETATFENLKVTATDMQESKGKSFFESDEGKIYVGVKFEIENISDESQSISSMLLFDAYTDDVKCNYSISAEMAFDDGSLDGEISPGKKLIGWYAVEVPEDWQKIDLEVKSSWLSNNKATFVFTK